jgi:pyruvate dehydrogenase E2 component (dihydrolipoamide acetyltransferase)
MEMIMDVKLPKLGEGADSGVVVSILVSEGDQVSEGQTIIELENEKAVAPVPSSAAGTVSSIRVKEGDQVTVGQVILTLGGKPGSKPAKVVEPRAREEDEGEAEDEAEVKPAAAREAVAGVQGSGGMAGMEGVLDQPVAKVAASPALRKLARELGIDLARVRGTERGGRVGTADVRRYIEALQRLAFESKPAAGGAKPVAAVERIDFSKWGPIERKPVSPLRKVIAERMRENWNTIPHVTQFDEADITGLMALRKKHAPAFEAKGVKLTLTGFAVRALVKVLKQHPVFNSSLDEAAGELCSRIIITSGWRSTRRRADCPGDTRCGPQELLELSREIEALAAKARDRKVALEELKGGTFTISNQGGIGGAHFTPIVNKPEVAILGLGRGALKAVVREKKVEPRLMLPLALSYDHRVIDGGSAARFMVDLVQALEQFPEQEVKVISYGTNANGSGGGRGGAGRVRGGVLRGGPGQEGDPGGERPPAGRGLPEPRLHSVEGAVARDARDIGRAGIRPARVAV